MRELSYVSNDQSIAPEAEYRDSRYVYSVKLLPGTDVKLISRYADEVRRLLEVEVLTFDLMSVHR